MGRKDTCDIKGSGLRRARCGRARDVEAAGEECVALGPGCGPDDKRRHVAHDERHRQPARHAPGRASARALNERRVGASLVRGSIREAYRREGARGAGGGGRSYRSYAQPAALSPCTSL
jgi:hypothetical protein